MKGGLAALGLVGSSVFVGWASTEGHGWWAVIALLVMAFGWGWLGERLLKGNAP